MMSEFEDLSSYQDLRVGGEGKTPRPTEFSTEQQRHKFLEAKRMNLAQSGVSIGSEGVAPPGSSLKQINDHLEIFIDRQAELRGHKSGAEFISPYFNEPSSSSGYAALRGNFSLFGGGKEFSPTGTGKAEQGFEIESFGDVTGIDPTEVKGTSYWDAGEWVQRAKDIGGMASYIPGPLGLPRGTFEDFMFGGEDIEESYTPLAQPQEEPQRGWGGVIEGAKEAIKREGVAFAEPAIRGLGAAGEITDPVKALAAMNPRFTGFIPGSDAGEFIRARYDVLISQGWDPTSALASAYSTAQEAGEIPFAEGMVYEAADVLELGPGGALVKPIKQVLRTVDKTLPFAKRPLTAGAIEAAGKGDNLTSNLDAFTYRSGKEADDPIATAPDVPTRQKFSTETGERIGPDAPSAYEQVKAQSGARVKSVAEENNVEVLSDRGVLVKTDIEAYKIIAKNLPDNPQVRDKVEEIIEGLVKEDNAITSKLRVLGIRTGARAVEPAGPEEILNAQLQATMKATEISKTILREEAAARKVSDISPKGVAPALTKEESDRLAFLKRHQEDMAEIEEARQADPGGLKVPAMFRTPDSGYRPSPPPTAETRASRIAEAKEEVALQIEGIKKPVEDAEKRIVFAQKELDSAKARGASEEELGELREDLREEKLNLKELKEPLKEARAELREAKKPFDMEAYNKAIATADEYDAQRIASQKRVTDQIAELEAKQAAVPDVEEAVAPVAPPRAIPGEAGQVPPEAPMRELTVGPEADNIPPGQGIKEAMDKASQFDKVDAPGSVRTVMESCWGARELLRYLNPRTTVPKAVQRARVAEVGVRSALGTKFFASRWPLLTRIDEVFVAKDLKTPGSRGGRVDVQFAGSKEDAEGIESIIGTVFDIAQRPDMYNLNRAQINLLQEWRHRMDAVLRESKDSYGVTVGEFTPDSWATGGVFLSNVDVGEDALKRLDVTAGQAVRAGRNKPRIFNSGADRIKTAKANLKSLNDDLASIDRTIATLGRGRGRASRMSPERRRLFGKKRFIEKKIVRAKQAADFQPEIDIARLVEGMDEAKATMAAREVFKEGSGGLTRVQVMDELHPGLRQERDLITNKVNNLRSRLNTAEQRSRTNRKQSIKSLKQVARLEKMAEPIRDRIDDLGREYGFELSHLSGQLYEIKKLITKAAAKKVDLASKEVVQGEATTSLLDDLKSTLEDLDAIRGRYAAADISDYQLVKDGVWRYYKVDEAKSTANLRETGSNSFHRTLENMRNTSFSADLGPILGQHIPMYAWANPHQAISRLIGAGKNSKETRDLLHAFRQDTMVNAINEDLQGYMDLAFFSGQSIKGQTATEFAGGLLNKIPGFTRANEAMFAVVVRQMKASYDTQLKSLHADNITGDAAKMFAADAVTKIIPLWHPARLGLSARRAAAIRAYPTSVSFLIRPAAMVAHASSGLAKFIVGQPISPQEKLALKITFKQVATISSLSVMTAVIAALREDRDPWKAALGAVDPYSPGFWDIDLGAVGAEGRTLPVGGPFKPVIQAILPRKSKTFGGAWVPFANIDSFVRNRVTPGLRTSLGLAINRDFYGGKVHSGHAAQRILSSLMFAVEGVAPLTLGSALSGVRRELEAGDIIEEVVGQFTGSSTQKRTPWQERNISIERWSKEQKLDPPVDNYMELSPSQRRDWEKAYPDEARNIDREIKRMAGQGIEWAVRYDHLQEVDRQRIIGEEELSGMLQSGKADKNHINEKEFRNRYADLQAAAANGKEILIDVWDIYEETGELPEDDRKRALVQYYAAFDEAKKDNAGAVDFESLEEIMADYENEIWTEEQKEYVKKNTRIGSHAPLVQEFLDDKKIIEESGYFESRRKHMKEAGLYELYLQYMVSSDQAGMKERFSSLASALKKATRKRKEIRIGNPDVERLLWKWGYIDSPVNRDIAKEVKFYKDAHEGGINNRLGITDPRPARAR